LVNLLNQEDRLTRAAQIRLVLTDLDETLVWDGHPVGARTLRAVKALQEAGVTVAVCTGRAPQSARPIIEQLGVHYYVCNNGATVYAGEQLLVQRSMPPAVSAGLISFFDAHGLVSLIATPAGYGLSRESDAFHRTHRQFPLPVIPESQWAQPTQKVHVPGSAHLYAECKAKFGDVANVIYHPRYIEVAPYGVSKQAGAQVLADLLGLTPDQVAMVGDGQNDLEAVRWAGLGCAMGNADPVLKAEADWILPSVTEDGAATLFELILASR
jgi:Cof subfamily protein (haloacid dehalogenase superfamily)